MHKVIRHTSLDATRHPNRTVGCLEGKELLEVVHTELVVRVLCPTTLLVLLQVTHLTLARAVIRLHAVVLAFDAPLFSFGRALHAKMNLRGSRPRESVGQGRHHLGCAGFARVNGRRV